MDVDAIADSGESGITELPGLTVDVATATGQFCTARAADDPRATLRFVASMEAKVHPAPL